MAARPEFSAFEAALPILGRDGTLARAVAADSPARGHARAKTGTYSVENGLNGTVVLSSKALAGYLETASGRPLIFAAFVNNVPLDAPRGTLPLRCRHRGQSRTRQALRGLLRRRQQGDAASPARVAPKTRDRCRSDQGRHWSQIAEPLGIRIAEIRPTLHRPVLLVGCTGGL